MKIERKEILYRAIYILILLIFILFIIFHLLKQPILGESEDLILIYSCMGLMGLIWIIHPKIFHKDNTSSKDTTWVRVQGIMFIIISILELTNYLG